MHRKIAQSSTGRPRNRFQDRAARRPADWLPLVTLPPAVALLTRSATGWQAMVALVFALLAGLKWLTWVRAVRGGLRPGVGRTLAYLFAWPGLDAQAFLDARVPATPPTMRDWLTAAGNSLAGAVLVWVVAPQFSASPLGAGSLGLAGLIVLLHCGLFRFLSAIWSAAGMAAVPLMDRPLVAGSIGEFWGRRWNRAFRDVSYRSIYQPLVRRSLAGAMLAVFAFSAVLHEVGISLPARAGFGLPSLYFLLQGAGLAIERSRFGRRWGLGRGIAGRLFALVLVVVPIPLLFFPAFVLHVIVPFLTVVHAL